MRISLLFAALAFPTIASATPVTFDDLRDLVQGSAIGSPEDLARNLPADLRANFILLHTSFTFPSEARLVSRSNPRVVLFSRTEDSFIALALINGSNNVEIIEWNNSEARFEPHLIEFRNQNATFDRNLQRCDACHADTKSSRGATNRRFRLNWDTYPFWPTAFGAIDKTSDDGGFHLQRDIEAPHIRNLGQDAFFRVFFDELYRQTPQIIGAEDRRPEDFVVGYDRLSSVNLSFTYAVSELNGRRLIADLKELSTDQSLLDEVVKIGKDAFMDRQIPDTSGTDRARSQIYEQSAAGLRILENTFGSEPYKFLNIGERMRYDTRYFTPELARRFDLQYLARIASLNAFLGERGVALEDYSSSFTSDTGEILRLPLFFDGGTSIVDRVYLIMQREPCESARSTVGQNQSAENY